MRLLSVLILANAAVNTQAAEPWFVDLPDFYVEQSPVELPSSDYGKLLHQELKDAIPIAPFMCGLTWLEPLNEADRLLADPRTIHFQVGKTYEVYIPIMGKEPVKKIRTMNIIQPNLPEDWTRRIY